MRVVTPPEAPDRRDQLKYHFDDTFLRRALTFTARLLFSLVAKMQVIGVEHLPASGAVVLAANHQTNFDVFPMQFALPRLIFFMAKAELHRNPLMDAVLRQLGSFPVERGSRDEWALCHAQEVLEHGLVLGIFPEGTRGKGKGLRPAKTGAARLALAMGCPIVPMAVVGTQRMFHRFPKRTLVSITLGEPVFPQHAETALALTDRLMFALADLLPPDQRGVYAQHPFGF
jgi:1-acyl-sn-glycerol-3-phosphate acyltransferase